MPSLLRTSRSFSFPPCIDSMDFPSGDSDIDEDPFSHFLTPINEEDDPFDGLTLSAGIIAPDGARTSKASKFKSNIAQKWARYVQHNHSNLHDRYHEAAEDDDDESFMQLDDERLLDTPHAVSQLKRPPVPSITVTEPTRGRAQELLPPSAHRRKRPSRTLSGRRRSWREPSPDLFTVVESEEADMHAKSQTKDGAERRRSHIEVTERAKL